jgi:hypothetical protein
MCATAVSRTIRPNPCAVPAVESGRTRTPTKKETFMAADIVNLLRKNSECLAPSIMLEAADTIERLRAELDEARRESDEYRRELWDHGGVLGQIQRDGE